MRRKYDDAFRTMIVKERLKGKSVKEVSREYRVCRKDVVDWVRCYEEGVPMKRRKKKKKKPPKLRKPPKFANVEEELEYLRASLAYKEEVIKFMEEKMGQQVVKKKTDLFYSED